MPLDRFSTFDRSDISQIISHLIRIKPDSANPKDVLNRILYDGVIKAHPAGIAINWDTFSDTSDPLKFHRHPVVCLTETPVHELANVINKTQDTRHKYSKYGLGFSKKDIFQVGGNPCFYLTSDNPSNLTSSLSVLSNHLVNTNNPTIKKAFETITAFCNVYSPEERNFYWEREWRIVGNYNFRTQNCQKIFIFAPENDFSFFRDAVGRDYENLHYIDLDWEF